MEKSISHIWVKGFDKGSHLRSVHCNLWLFLVFRPLFKRHCILLTFYVVSCLFDMYSVDSCFLRDILHVICIVRILCYPAVDWIVWSYRRPERETWIQYDFIIIPINYIVSLGINYRFCEQYMWFICFPLWSIDELENLHADWTFWAITEAEGEVGIP